MVRSRPTDIDLVLEIITSVFLGAQSRDVWIRTCWCGRARCAAVGTRGAAGQAHRALNIGRARGTTALRRVASTQCPLRLWLGAFGDAVFLAAFSQQNVACALGEYGTPMTVPIPKGAAGGRTVPDVPALHRLLRRAFQLSKALPNELLHTFEKQVAARPKTTEAERLVVQRVGQNLFRDGLLDLWEGRCAVTRIAVPALLRASHTKPWADCETDAERLDVYNGILLAPHLDAAFDQGFITVADDGTIVVSDALDADARTVLGLDCAFAASPTVIEPICRGTASACSSASRRTP